MPHGHLERVQLHIDEDGIIENSKEQEEQIIVDREAKLKVNRHWSRVTKGSKYLLLT